MRIPFLEVRSLSAKTRVGFVLMPVLLALILILFSVFQLISYQNHTLEGIAQNTAYSYSDKVDRNFYERFGDVQAFSNNSLVQEAIVNASKLKGLEDYMNGLMRSYVMYDLMIVCDSAGRVVTASRADKGGVAMQTGHIRKGNYASARWFRRAIESMGPSYLDFSIEEDIIKIDPSKYDGHSMAFSCPIVDSTGRLLGVWVNFANWKLVTSKIRMELEDDLVIQHPNSFLIMTDTLGRIIDAGDQRLIEKQDSLFASHLSGETRLTFKKAETDLSDFVQGKATGKGAYTYEGRHWNAYSFIPKKRFSFGVLFSKDLTGLYISIFVLIVFVSWLANKFTISIARRLQYIKDGIVKLSNGEIVTLKENGNDELTEMSKLINTLSSHLKQKVVFSEEIGQGKLETEFELHNENDELGKSLITMRDSLLSFNRLEEKRKWVTEGMAQFGEILRQNDSFEKLCDNILSRLVKYVNANQAGIFVVRPSEEQPKLLDLISCYAYNRKKYLERTIKEGQGLVGQCYIEKNYIYLDDIPQDYLVITSGLGEATPNILLLMPLAINGEVHGVLEIASFNPIEDYQLDFLQKLSESIASSINLARSNETTRRLYEESKMMTEELRAQEEEMRQNMEELMATQEEIERKEQEYLQRIEELEKALYERDENKN